MNLVWKHMNLGGRNDESLSFTGKNFPVTRRAARIYESLGEEHSHNMKISKACILRGLNTCSIKDLTEVVTVDTVALMAEYESEEEK